MRLFPALFPALNRPMKAWHGKTVWIVGASSGIGEATAAALHAVGARVIVSARQAQTLGALPQSLAYGPTKAALINLAETLYQDLRPRGIGVSLINPGFVQIPLTAGGCSDRAGLGARRIRNPLPEALHAVDADAAFLAGSGLLFSGAKGDAMSTSGIPTAAQKPVGTAADLEANVARVVAFFETLTPTRIADLGVFYDAQARFVVTGQVVQGRQCFLTGSFTSRSRLTNRTAGKSSAAPRNCCSRSRA